MYLRWVQGDYFKNTCGQMGNNEDEEDKGQGDSNYKTILNGLRTDFFRKWKDKKADNATLEDFQLYRTVGTGAFGRVVLVNNL